MEITALLVTFDEVLVGDADVDDLGKVDGRHHVLLQRLEQRVPV